MDASAALLAPGGLRMFDPLRVDSAAFLAVLARLAEAHWRAFGQELPRWALYDCAQLPGCVFGAALSAGDLPEDDVRAFRRQLALDAGTTVDTIPLSLLVALPTIVPGHWLIARLGCVNEVLPMALGARVTQALDTQADAARQSPAPLLASTLAAFLRLVSPARVLATSEWHAAALAAHAAFAPLALRAAWLPVHDVPATAVFEYPGQPPAAPSDHGEGQGRTWLDVADHARLQGLQRAREEDAGDPARPGLDIAAVTRANARIEVAIAPTAGEPVVALAETRSSARAHRADPSSAPTIQPENPKLLDQLELFVVALPGTCARLDGQPFGVPVRASMNPLRSTSADFLELLRRLDAVTFGREGMSMPRWLYLSGVALTGAIVGLGRAHDRIPPAVRRLLGVADTYRGLVPYAVYMAIPTVETDVWLGHNLASVARLAPDEELAGLGSLTKALALKMYRARAQIGATQWASGALFVHTRMGPLQLASAYTPAHSEPRTLTYRADIDDAVLFALVRDPRGRIATVAPSEWIADHDLQGMRDLQARIEAGQRFVVAGRPVRDQRGQRVPIAAWPMSDGN